MITVTVIIITLDNTVLNVSIPTILREFHTTLPSLQWVITGYALTFATLLILGGRLGDLFGHRRIFVIGAGLFAVGSLVASESTGVPMLVLGEAVIEGIGASMMLPATLAILSSTFRGHERSTAFGIWGATGGASAVLGPVVGGFLTTNYSWRWCFRINVVIAPLAIVGALVFMARDAEVAERSPIDVPGALMVALGMLLLVFGLSEGGTYGWWRPIADVRAGGAVIWQASLPVSIVPVSFVVAVGLLSGFVAFERAKERGDRDPLFEFGQLRRRGFRYGLLVTLVMSVGQFGIAFVLPVFLQDGRHLSAQLNGLWQLPTGLFVLIGAQVGSRLTRRIGVTTVVRTGLLCLVGGFVYVAMVISVGLTFWELLPGLAVYGLGVGFATTQLTNVVLFDVDPERSGVAGGANSTARQVGLALGVAVMGSMLSLAVVTRTVQRIRSAPLGAVVKGHAIAQVRSAGVSFSPRDVSAHDAVVLKHAFVAAIASSARVPLLFAAGMIALAGLLSLCLPRVSAGMTLGEEAAEAVGGVDGLEVTEAGRPLLMLD